MAESFFSFMKQFLWLIWQGGLVMATTIGAGVFALPYIFKESGWFVSIFYLVVLGGLIVMAHYFYWLVLKKTGGENRLLGFAKIIFGKIGFNFAFVVIVGGLFLALVVYLILGSQFLKMIFPSLRDDLALAIFWFLSSFPLVLKLKRLAGLEFLGAILMTTIILLVFFGAGNYSIFEKVSAINFKNLLLPFGAILFSLAAWTVVEPIYELNKNTKNETKKNALFVFLFGTFLAAAFYFLFIVGIFGSAAKITPDTLSGLVDWPFWKIVILGIFGLFAIWTSYIPISLEIKNSLEKDLSLGKILSIGLLLFLPPFLITLGLDSFLRAVELAGGLFLSLQYLLIFVISRKILDLSRIQKIFLNILLVIFALAAVYEIYYFVIS